MIDEIGSSKLADLAKLRLIGQAHRQNGNYEQAVAAYEQIRATDAEPNTDLVLAELYRELRRPADEVNSLRRAFESDPQSTDVRNRLALAIAIQNGRDVDWSEIGQLLSIGPDISPDNRLLYAMLLASGGDVRERMTNPAELAGTESQMAQATTLLREIIEERSTRHEDASRVLALVLQRQASLLTPDQEELRSRMLREVRSLYDDLSLTTQRSVYDVYRHAVFLIDFSTDDTEEIDSLRDELMLSRDGVVLALDIDLRTAPSKDRQAEAVRRVDAWVQEVTKQETLMPDEAAAVGGTALLEMQIETPAIVWLERAYLENQDRLRDYVVALHQVGRIKESVDVCATHYKGSPDAECGFLLVESLVALGGGMVSSVRHLVQEILNKHGSNAAILEAVATLQMQDGQYAEAADLYQRALSIDPNRIRSLNNLALSLARLPDRATHGLRAIDAAIELAGEHAELLDTRGVVLLRAGKHQQAEAAFQQAITKNSEEARYRFHLVSATLAQNKREQARQQWRRMKLESLDVSGLMPEERKELEKLKLEFGH